MNSQFGLPSGKYKPENLTPFEPLGCDDSAAFFVRGGSWGVWVTAVFWRETAINEEKK